MPYVPAVVLIQDADQLGPAVLALVNEHVARVRQSPDSAEAHGNLGLVYEANSFWDEATRCYANAERLAPGDHVWAYHRAVTMREAGDTEGALALLRRLAREQPDIPAIQQRFGESLLEANDVEEAAEIFERVIALAPESSLGYVGLGDVRMGQGQYVEAKRLLEKAVILDPGYKAAHYSLGLAYRGLGEHEAARPELSKGLGARRRIMRDALTDKLESYSASLTARLDLSRRYKAGGRLDKAAEVLEAAVAVWPGSAAVLNNLATIYIAQKRHEDAMALLVRVRELDDTPFATYTNLAACCLELNRLDEALAYAQRAIEAAPANSNCHLSLATILTRSQRYEEALDSLRTAARLDPRDPAPRLKQGRIYLRMERYEEARQHYQTAARLAPSSLTAHLNLAATSMRVGRLEGAAEALAVAEMIEPHHDRVSLLKERLVELRNR